MKTLTIKTFGKELLVNFSFFSALCFLYVIMATYPGLSNFWNMIQEFVSFIPLGIIWLIYCILFDHYVFKLFTEQKKKGKAVITLLILTVCIFMVEIFILFPGIYIKTKTGYDNVVFITFLFRWILFTVYAFFYSFIAGFIRQREKRLQAEKAAAENTLQNLRSQIEPHFIFNTLNNIYALSLEENASKTANSIEELSGLFRYTLKESKADKVSVADELEFIEKYIHLHAIRLLESKNIQLQTNITWDKKPASIAPLLIINFIENAFKYGISMEHPSLVKISAAVQDAHLHLEVKNSVHENSKAVQNGFGLDNTHKRLDLLYAGKYDLKEIKKDGLHEIDLTINLG